MIQNTSIKANYISIKYSNESKFVLVLVHSL